MECRVEMRALITRVLWHGFLQLSVAEKTQNVRRLEAQRNELNAKGKDRVHFFTLLSLSLLLPFLPLSLTAQFVYSMKSYSCCRSKGRMWGRSSNPWTRRRSSSK